MTKTKLQQIQEILGVEADGIWGKKTEAALEEAKAEGKRPTSNGAGNEPPPAHIYGELKGDGTWPWKARIDGDDIVVENARMTCFGGSDDPQDSGETASGISTKKNPDLAAVSLPMDGRMFKHAPKAVHEALDGSPIPKVPFRTIVRVTVDTKSFDWPVIDIGPAKWTGNALDLTIAAARRINPKATARNFEARGSFRIFGAAKYVPGIAG